MHFFSQDLSTLLKIFANSRTLQANQLIEVKLSTQLSVSILNQSVWFSGGSTCSSTTTHCVALVQTLVNRKEQGAKPTEAIYDGK